MFKSNVFLLAFLLFAANTFAARLVFWADYKQGTGPSDHTSKMSPKGVPDDKEDDVVNKIGEWSDGKYTAKKNRLNIITIKNKDIAKDRDAATDLIKDMEKVYRAHVKEEDDDDD